MREVTAMFSSKLVVEKHKQLKSVITRQWLCLFLKKHEN